MRLVGLIWAESCAPSKLLSITGDWRAYEYVKRTKDETWLHILDQQCVLIVQDHSLHLAQTESPYMRVWRKFYLASFPRYSHAEFKIKPTITLLSLSPTIEGFFSNFVVKLIKLQVESLCNSENRVILASVVLSQYFRVTDDTYRRTRILQCNCKVQLKTKLCKANLQNHGHDASDKHLWYRLNYRPIQRLAATFSNHAAVENFLLERACYTWHAYLTHSTVSESLPFTNTGRITKLK